MITPLDFPHSIFSQTHNRRGVGLLFGEPYGGIHHSALYRRKLQKLCGSIGRNRDYDSSKAHDGVDGRRSLAAYDIASRKNGIEHSVRFIKNYNTISCLCITCTRPASLPKCKALHYVILKPASGR